MPCGAGIWMQAWCCSIVYMHFRLQKRVPAGGHHDFCRLWVPYDLPEALQLQCTWAQLLLFLHCHIRSPLSRWSCATGEVHDCRIITLRFNCNHIAFLAQ